MRWPGQVRPACALLVLAACYAPHVAPGVACGPDDTCPAPLTCVMATGTCEPAGGAGPDAGRDAGGGSFDAAPDGSPVTGCYGSGRVTVCTTHAPAPALSIAAATTIDTDAGMCDATVVADASLCVVVAGTIDVEATLAATGSRPLVLVATDRMTIAGTVDAASHRGPDTTGAGADAAACLPPAPATGEAGGAGGSFGGKGGKGGGTSGAGIASPPQAPTALRGGCPGGAGTGPAAGMGDQPGHGGGAIALIAGSDVVITGDVDASGEGGGGNEGYGASGGGAGGMIVVDAPSVTVAMGAQVFANGGGGGGTGLGQGAAGGDPASATTAAPGGSGALLGATGGDGSVGADLDGAKGGGTAAIGGGGGGAAGVIEIYGTSMVSGAVSPPPT